MFLSHESHSCVPVNVVSLRWHMGKISGQVWSVAGDRGHFTAGCCLCSPAELLSGFDSFC